MRVIFVILVVLHGLIHLLGFTKALNLASIDQLSQHISKGNGVLWMISAILFIVTALLFLQRKDLWWIFSAVAILLSQYLIFSSWQDAKYGTIVNVIILIVTFIGYGNWSFSNTYENEVETSLKQTASVPDSPLTEEDLQHLPEAVRKYLHYSGAVGKPKVKNFKVELIGQIRKNEQSEWMPFTSEQYNFIEVPTRLFFMKATMKHLPIAGFHCFKNGDAFMDIRLFSLLKVQYQSGKEMGVAETVTFFNDMCVMAPATLIDQRIQWLETKGNKVKAAFTNNGITVYAWLHFNDKGELVNFISEDRYAQQDDGSMKQLLWSTPMKDYKQINGYKLASYADAVYQYPEGDLIYGTFRLTDVEMNYKSK